MTAADEVDGRAHQIDPILTSAPPDQAGPPVDEFGYWTSGPVQIDLPEHEDAEHPAAAGDRTRAMLALEHAFTELHADEDEEWDPPSRVGPFALAAALLIGGALLLFWLLGGDDTSQVATSADPLVETADLDEDVPAPLATVVLNQPTVIVPTVVAPAREDDAEATAAQPAPAEPEANAETGARTDAETASAQSDEADEASQAGSAAAAEPAEPTPAAVEEPEFAIPADLAVAGQGRDDSGRLFVELRWSQPSGAAFVEIERDGTAIHREEGLVYRDVPDPTLTAGQEVTYRIRSLSQDQTTASEWSAPLTITIEQAPLSSPARLRVTDQGRDDGGRLFIDLAWDRPPGATSVEIERDGVSIPLDGATYRDIPNPTLIAGQPVTYRIRSLNESDNATSAWSSPITVIVAAPPLRSPTGLTARSQGIDQSGQLFITLVWDTPPDATTVEIERNGTIIITNNVGTYTDLNNFSTGERVVYRARSINEDRLVASNWSDQLIVTVGRPALGVPADVTVSGQGIDDSGRLFVEFSWSKPPRAEFVEVQRDGLIIGDTDADIYRDVPNPSLSPGQEVTYRVRSLDSTKSTTSEWSALITVTVDQPDLAPPTNLTVARQGADTAGQLFIDLAWDMPSGASTVEIERNGTIIGESDDGAYSDVADFTPGQQLTYRARALNPDQADPSAWSTLVVTVEEPVLDPPTNVVVANQGIDASGRLFIELAWDSALRAATVVIERDGLIIATDDLGTFRDVPNPSLTPGQQVTYRLRSLNQAQTNSSAWSDSITVTVEAPELDPPTNLVVTNQGIDPSGQLLIDLAWDTPPLATSVLLERNGVVVANSDTGAYSDVADFTPGQQLTYRARALNPDQADPSAWSTLVVTVEEPVLDPPTNVVVANQGIDASGRLFIELAWDSALRAATVVIERDGLIIATDDLGTFRDVPNPSLTPGQQVIYRLRSLNQAQTNSSAWSDSITVTVEAPALDAPTNLVVTNQGTDPSGQLFIDLAWDTPLGAATVEIERDNVIITNDDSDAYRDIPTPALTPGQEVVYRVRALDQSQTAFSEWSSPITIVVS